MAHIIKVKSESTSGSPSTDQVRRPMAFDLPDWSKRAEEYLAKVREQAAQILRDAEQEAKAIRSAAEQRGYADGQKRAATIATEVAQKQLQSLMPSLESFTKQLQQLKGEWLRQWENGVIDLAVAAGGCLAGRALSQDPEITQQWIREALELISSPGRVVLRIHPQDHAALSSHIEALASCLHPAAELVVQSDADIEPGGAVVQTDFGEINQQLSGRIQRLREELLSE